MYFIQVLNLNDRGKSISVYKYGIGCKQKIYLSFSCRSLYYSIMQQAALLKYSNSRMFLFWGPTKECPLEYLTVVCNQ